MYLTNTCTWIIMILDINWLNIVFYDKIWSSFATKETIANKTLQTLSGCKMLHSAAHQTSLLFEINDSKINQYTLYEIYM